MSAIRIKASSGFCRLFKTTAYRQPLAGAAVRGIVNDDQDRPLPPPGLRMAAALTRRRKLARVLRSFAPRRFGGPDQREAWRNHLGLERRFRRPQRPERRIHGRRHAGVGLVQEGPTLAHA